MERTVGLLATPVMESLLDHGRVLGLRISFVIIRRCEMVGYEIIKPEKDLANHEYHHACENGTRQGWERNVGVKSEDMTRTVSNGREFWLHTKKKVTIEEMVTNGWVMVYDSARRKKQ